MRILYRFGVEFFWTAFWVFAVLIVGFAVLTWLSNRNFNGLSTAAGWVESRAKGD